MAARERKENFVPHLLTFLLPILFSFPRTPQKISVGVGCSWALYDGVGVWPVAGAEEKWPGTEYGKRCYNSSGTTHHPTADVLDMKENTDLRQEPRENAPRCHWEKNSFFKTQSIELQLHGIENARSNWKGLYLILLSSIKTKYYETFP